MSWISRLRNAIHPARLEQDLDDEIRHHLDGRAADFEAQGISRPDAERRATLAFGNVAHIREQSRDRRLWPALESVCQDLRYGWRGMWRAPVFSAAAILSLGLAIGANTAIYSVVDAFLLRPLRVPDAGRLVTIDGLFSYPNWTGLSARAGDSARLALFDDPNRVEADQEQAIMQTVTDNVFEVVGIPPAEGRLLSAEDFTRPSAVLSYDYWQRRYHGDPSVPGRAIVLNGRSYSIVGVAGQGFTGVEPGKFVDVWTPISAGDPGILTNPGFQPFRLLGRLAATTTRPALAARLGAPIEPAATGLSSLRATFTRPLWILAGLAAVILLIACANVATMLLARSLARSGETALRLSLGAGRVRVVRQFLTESLLLAGFAGVVGWAIARVAAPVLPSILSLRLDLSVSPAAAVFCLGICALSTVLFGGAPALFATRSALMQGIRARGSRAGRFFVALQVAFAFSLVMVGAGFVFTLRNLSAVHAGFDPRGVTVLTMANDLGPADRSRQLELLWQTQSRIGALPAVQGAATAWMPIFSGASRRDRVVLPGRPASNQDEIFYRVSPGYLATLRTPLLAGRDLTIRDNDDEPIATIVNRAFARKYFGTESVLGLEFQRDDGARHRIVGLAGDSHYADLRRDAPPIAYFPMKPPRVFTLYVRSTLDTASVTRMVQREAQALGGGLRVRETTTLDSLVGGTVRTETMLAGLGGAFAALGLLLAAIGVYGLLSYAVTRRTQEIGIRTALGASRLRLYALILQDLGAILAVGLTAGLAGSLMVLRAAQSILFGVSAVDPIVIGTAVAILGGAAILAAVLPALRIAAIDPIAAIRHE